MVNIVIDSTEREIELLREYRTRLTADVVTGKLDVRKAARHLPDEPNAESLAPEEDTLFDDSEEVDAEELLDRETEP